MKPIDILAYGLMFACSLAWVIALYGGLGLPRLVAIVLALVLGPVSVVIGSAVLTSFFDDRKK